MPAIKSITEVADNRGASLSLTEGQVGALTKRAYKRAWVVEFDPADVPSDPADAIAAVPVGIGDVYLSALGVPDFACFCGSIEPAQYKAPWVWMVTASYSSDLDLSNPSGDPLLMPPVFSWGKKSATRPATLYDAKGNVVAGVNSAGDPIDPPPTAEETWTTLEIARNWASFDPVKMSQFDDTVNEFAYLGFGPLEVLCTGVTAESEYVKGAVIWKVRGRFEIKADGPKSWALQILDRGFQGYDNAGNKRVFVDQATGRSLSGASLLDGTGKQLARNAAPVFLTFYTKAYMDFSTIGLP